MIVFRPELAFFCWLATGVFGGITVRCRLFLLTVPLSVWTKYDRGVSEAEITWPDVCLLSTLCCYPNFTAIWYQGKWLYGMAKIVIGLL